ncbi:hypothetical protein Patl1_08299 [Pistacia atlantica]|uniref:Uncharacterized protein n=1 Tax=Pistacia atlantica TaxID=434234 RepID=A0ACC1AJ59_9ROSI|nr:hypothetical protein Patl1_08299 [Pistacia atlantica]
MVLTTSFHHKLSTNFAMPFLTSTTTPTHQLIILFPLSYKTSSTRILNPPSYLVARKNLNQKTLSCFLKLNRQRT